MASRGGWAAVVGAVLLAACAPMGTPVADGGPPPADGGPLVDGGAPDAGAADGGRADGGPNDPDPDGGPREPTTATQVLYTDDFERYTNTVALKASYGDQRELGASLSLDTAVAAVGANALRVDYATDAGCQDADVFLSKVLALTTPLTVALQYRFRFEPQFRFQQPAAHCAGRGTASTEFVIGRVMNGRGTVVLSVAADAPAPVIHPDLPGQRWQVEVRDVRATVTPAQPHALYRQHQRFTRLGPQAVTDGRWHALTLLVQRETQAGLGDGVIRVWIDGEAVLDYDGAAGPAAAKVFSGTAPFGIITYPSTLAAGASQPQARWFDEVVLFQP